MDHAELEKIIGDRLSERGKKVVNRSALRALFGGVR
jgi:hypothetical protein